MVRRELYALQAVRAIAASLVVVFHTSHSIFGLPKYWSERPFGDFFEFGHAGVEMFFVLSGFIIFSAHWDDVGDASRFKNFVWKRFRRVYPIYWVVLATLIPLFFLFPNLGSGSERLPGVLFDSVILVHLFGDGGFVSSVSWTLFHEIAFYSVFSVLLLNARYGFIALGVWMATSFIALGFGSALPGALLFYCSPMHLLFGMGMVAAWLINKRTLPAPLAVLCVGLTMFLGIGMEEVYGPYPACDAMTLLYGLSSALIVAGAVELERSGRLKIPNFLVFIGNASYSVYLVHVVGLSLLAKLALKLFVYHPVPLSLLFIGLAGGALCCGLIYHVAVEVPLLALIGRRSTVSNRVPRATLATMS